MNDLQEDSFTPSDQCFMMTDDNGRPRKRKAGIAGTPSAL